MRIVHDCLDAQLLDRRGTKMGRVDSIVAVVDDEAPDRPPTVVAIEIGAVPLAHRLHPRIGRWVARWLARRDAANARPFRIDWSDLRRRGNDFVVDVDARDTPAWTSERWAASRIVKRIPGA